ncbi:MAG: two-component regulator propeller domain-containing protein [Aureliella sp.]
MTMSLPMAWLPLFFIVLCLVGLSPSSLAYSAEEFASAGQETTAEIAKRIVIRSLPAIQEGGQSWISENDCLSCHRVSLQVWALNRAEEHGFPTDRKQLTEWNSWATSWRNLVKPHLRSETSMETALTSESDTVAQLLLGRPRWKFDQPLPGTNSKAEDPGESEWIATFRDHLAKAQRDDGAWEPAGQLPKQKRPLRETTEVTTMWALLALYDAGLSKPRLQEVFSTARTFLDKAAEPKSTEWLATKLMVSRKFGSTAQAQVSRRNLLRMQRVDGGWGWLTKDSSDALATGLALYALAQDGLSYSDQPVRKAIAFLARTQRSDGMWDVKGTKMEDRDNVAETASYWGTTWVAISLMEFQQTESNRDGKKKKLASEPHHPRPAILTSFTGNEFENRIRPLLMKYCNDCHAGPNNYGLNFMNLEAAENFAEYQHRFVSVVREMESATMPPKDAEQPTASDREFMVGWLRKQLEKLTPPGKPVIPDVSQQIAQYVVQIYEDRNGNLWFGTMSRGAAR